MVVLRSLKSHSPSPFPNAASLKLYSISLGGVLTVHRYLLNKETLTIIKCGVTPTSALGTCKHENLFQNCKQSCKVKHVLSNHKRKLRDLKIR